MKMVVILCVMLIPLSGCSSDVEMNSESDQDLARETLIAALDAWKAGHAQSLAKRTPPIRLGDDDQRAGLQLQTYEITEPNEPIHPFRDVKVELTLRNRQGQTSTKIATYQVGLEPNISVLRSDN